MFHTDCKINISAKGGWKKKSHSCESLIKTFLPALLRGCAFSKTWRLSLMYILWLKQRIHVRKTNANAVENKDKWHKVRAEKAEGLDKEGKGQVGSDEVRKARLRRISCRLIRRSGQVRCSGQPPPPQQTAPYWKQMHPSSYRLWCLSL